MRLVSLHFTFETYQVAPNWTIEQLKANVYP